MDFVTILLLSIAVAADCFVVSVSNGIALNKFIFSPIIKMAFLFGLFQAMMPVFSWLAGKQCGSWIEPYDHWVALAILSFLGAKMIWESFDENSDSESEVVLHWGRLIILAIATSIDALAIGLLFVTEATERFIFAIICIGLCSFFFFTELDMVRNGFLGQDILEKIGFFALLHHTFISITIIMT